MNTEEFRQSLLDAGLLVDGGVDGLYLRSFRFESIVRGLEAYISSAWFDPRQTQLFLPPIMPLSTLVTAGYATSFPNLIGTISSFMGSERELVTLLEALSTGEDWSAHLTQVEVALCSASCHPIYPLLRSLPVPDEGLLYEVQCPCFRHEPSHDPARMQSFRQHEYIYVGPEEGARTRRELWIAGARELLEDLGLDIDVVEANDPFFGRAGQLLAAGQREKVLKYELMTRISSDSPGAVCSGNYHEDHFGKDFGLSLSDGSIAHSACFGFGLDRITLSLLFTHGLDVDAWPSATRQRLFATTVSPGTS